MKRIFKTTLVLICVLSMLFAIPTAYAAVYTGSCGSDLIWNFNTVSGTLTINGSGIMDDYSADNHAPWFEYRDEIKSVTIGNQVRTIGDYAFFYCTKLSAVNGCGILGEIGDHAFARSGIKSFSANSNLRLIGEKAFSYCNELTYVDTGDVTVISDSAFEHCNALTNVVFSSGLVEIGDYAFNCCEALEAVELSCDAVTIGIYAFTRSGVASVTLTGATKIGKGAFYHCSELNSVTIPTSTTTIGDRAFTSCDSLDSISFEGNAPAVTKADISDRSFDADIILNYNNTASGWTSPTWNGYITSTQGLLGDINDDGELTNVDLVTLARYIVELETFNDKQLLCADMDGNGEISNSDLVAVARCIVSL